MQFLVNVIVALIGYHLIIHNRTSISVSGLLQESHETNYRLSDAVRRRSSVSQQQRSNCHVTVNNDTFTVPMKSSIKSSVEIQCSNLTELSDSVFTFKSDNKRVAEVAEQGSITANDFQETNNTLVQWKGNVTINSHFLGTALIRLEQFNPSTSTTTILVDRDRKDGNGDDDHNHNKISIFKVVVIRKQRIIDHVFTGSVAVLVSLLYIIFGAALDLNILKNLLQNPAGPIIGFLSQFIIMPLLSYGIGYIIFPNSVEMQLGLFFTGVSPSGGASNMWSAILGGNMTLSLLMTTISNFAAFGTMPLWIFTLGSLIFARGHMSIPYKNIVVFAVSLILPLAIGLTIQKFSSRMTKILMRLMKPASSCLILFIVLFAIVTNLYLFELFSWQIIAASLLLPWLGYVLAWLLAKTFRQNAVDALTIAIEAGIQNTGIAIFLLRFSLPQPQDDLTTVIPVGVAIMTPLPLFGIYLYKRFTTQITKPTTSRDDFSSENSNE